jgi:putative two-component system hydrogenase maturation factor HypX/HoxX
MRVLLLTHSFNSLAQRLFGLLHQAGHSVSVELDIADSVTEEAVALFKPDVVLAPFLKRRIPESIWAHTLCLVVHPGIPGDRGPSALDWMLMRGDTHWGVTVLQATAELDAGAVWAWEPFAVRPRCTKSSVYRREVTQAAAVAVIRALQRLVPARIQAENIEQIDLQPLSNKWIPLLRQEQRRINWQIDNTATVLRKIAAADGFPGVLDALWGQACRLFDAHPASTAVLESFAASLPGDLLARRGPALLRRTLDGAVWIGHVRPDDGLPVQADGTQHLKLATTRVFATQAAALPELNVPPMRDENALGIDPVEWDELRYREFGPAGARVGWLDFDFYNGAMSTRQCERLRDALRWVRGRATQVLVLAGGAEFFSNGIHLHDIEASQRVPGDSAADASMRNITAMDDVALEVLTLTDRITVAALHGNAGAGGCFLALTADQVWAHEGVVLNPHYKNMGNLYGSEYWTYSLPRRMGETASRALMQGRLPLQANDAVAAGLLDACFAADAQRFGQQALARALTLAAEPGLQQRTQAKQAQRAQDEAIKPLAQYRADELQRMSRNFYGFDPSYHVARHHFVYRKPHAWTPRHLAVHRELQPRGQP